MTSYFLADLRVRWSVSSCGSWPRWSRGKETFDFNCMHLQRAWRGTESASRLHKLKACWRLPLTLELTMWPWMHWDAMCKALASWCHSKCFTPQIGTVRPTLSQAHACLIWRSLKNERRRCHNGCIPFLSARASTLNQKWHPVTFCSQCKGLIFGAIGQNVPTTLTILHDHKQLPSFFGANKSSQCFEVWLPLCAVQIQLKQNKHIVLNLFSFDWGKLVYIQWAMFSMLNC